MWTECDYPYLKGFQNITWTPAATEGSRSQSVHADQAFVLFFTAGELVFYGSCGKHYYLFTLLLLCVLAVTCRAGAVGCVRHTANSSWRGGALLSLWMSSFALFCLSLSPELFIGNTSIIYSVYMAEYNSNYELLLVPPFSPCHTEMARKVVT